MSTQNDAQLVQQLEQFRQEFMDEIGNVIIGQQNILDHFLFLERYQTWFQVTLL